MIMIKKTTIAEIEANENFSALAKEYAEESSIHGLPAPVEKIATYRVIESTGFFQAYGAFLGEVLVGFIAILTPVIPHYGVAIAVAESFFVAKAYRKTGAGLKLLRAGQDHAKSAGSPGFLVSAPTGGVLANVLPRLGYRETNRVFFKELSHV